MESSRRRPLSSARISLGADYVPVGTPPSAPPLDFRTGIDNVPESCDVLPDLALNDAVRLTQLVEDASKAGPVLRDIFLFERRLGGICSEYSTWWKWGYGACHFILLNLYSCC